MERLRNLLVDIDQETLIQMLSTSGYPFAAWRMPGTDKSNFIVGLSELKQIESALTDLDAGFLMNPFSSSHPIAPYHIKADLVIDDEIKVDPRIDAKQLEEFEQVITKASTVEERKKHQSLVATDFEKLVAKAIRAIGAGTLEKVVLSRYKDVKLPGTFSLKGFFENVCNTYPNAFCSMVHLPGEGVWVGATPELLISENETGFKTIALAGTKALETGQPLSEIAWTQKEIEEQAFVSRYIINCFKKIRLREFHEHGPKTVNAGGLAHLKTVFEVKYGEVPYEGLANQMLDLLHPTSAVCGMPLQAALSFIEENEHYDRGFYSGFLGPTNFSGSTDLFVNLRCMHIIGDSARLFAGAGITQDSIPSKELTETELKMNTLLSVI